MTRNRDDDALTKSLEEAFVEVSALVHKINNPLTSLIGRAQLLRLAGTNDDRVLRTAQVIEDSATRVADHVRELALIVRAARQSLAERTREHETAGVE